MEYSIQEASELLSIPIQKLRRWDEQGVLVALRTSGGHRRYSRELIDRLAASGFGATADKTSQELATVKRALAEKRRIIQLLLESENRYRDLVETSHDLIWATDAEGRFTYLNTAAYDIFGLAPKDLIGRCFFNFEAGAAHVGNRRFLATLRRKGEVKNYVTHVLTTDGENRWIGINARLTNDDLGEPLGIRGTARDITEQHVATQRIEHLALHDPLTDLPNRHSLQIGIEAAMQDSSVGALLFIDIDHFKYVNDNFGHRAGDQLIIGVGSVLREVVRGCGGEVYRLGGDEFAIHLPEALRKQANHAAELALDAVRHYRFQASEQRVVSNLSASIGIALYPFHGSDVPSLFSNVDIAMYQAKELGRNRHMVFDQASDNLRSTHKRVHWAKRIRDALDDDRITLFAQPVVRLKDQKAMHHEVLVRLRDDQGGFILPSTFIEIAESLSLVQELDLQVVEKLLAFMREHNQVGKKLRYFVNLSRVSIADPHWVKRLMSLLTATQVDPTQLVFEITETAAMSEIDVTLSFINRLKDIGCRFALDDFGAGFSSFYYLKRFEVDYLKIDGSFIRDLATDEGSRLFVRALNDVARGLSKQVVAEWVESPEALKLLVEMGAQYGQGYIFRKPMPIADTVRAATNRLLRAKAG
ncbi:MAG: signal transduction protein [Betaproteobacteria bacterium]|jgi:diguanylate cyclase (GGDEF)-like protein/PAS domain S-box-containing protein/excisionase family DNA binding protein|nr:signal transduction protein [Betaproteobacteria bacterium]